MVETLENGHVNGVEGGEVDIEAMKAQEMAPKIPTEAPKKYDIPNAKLADIEVTPYMTECLDKVALAEGFKKYEVNVVHGSGVGDGFVGLVFKAIIQEIDSDKKMIVVVKSPPTNVARRTMMGSMDLFEREVYMYSVALPEAAKFQQEKKIKPGMGFFEFPKCYYAEFDKERDESIIIMEDLRENGYKMWDKFTPTNFEHAKLIFSALGRWHAVSLAMKAQRPDIFDKFKALGDFMATKMSSDPNFEEMMNNMVDRAVGTIDEKDTKRRARVAKLKEGLAETMMMLVDPNLAEPFAVIGHGDCWSNNFMFQYKRGFPVNICLLDWQISRYVSPILDLVYFTFVCTSKEMRARHYDELLNIYHRSLKDLLDHLGGDTMTQFPFTALLRQLKQFGKFGVIMASMLIPMLSTKNEELPDMDYMAENMDNKDEEFMKEMMEKFGAGNNDYEKRMQGVLLDAMRYGYL